MRITRALARFLTSTAPGGPQTPSAEGARARARVGAATLLGGSANGPQTLTASGGRVRERVTPFVTSPHPVIGVAVQELEFDADAGVDLQPTALTIVNTGAGLLSGLSIESSASWVTPALASTTADPATSATLTFATAALAPGTYPATLTLRSSVPAVDPVVIALLLTVTAITAPTGIRPGVLRFLGF